MSNIYFEPDRQGMTVLPDQFDEATGERIENTSQVVDTRVANWHGQSPDTYEDVSVDEDALNPLEVEPSFEVRLADTFDEINTTPFDINPEFANEIAAVDMGDSREAITVQYLASKVFNGDMTPEESFQHAVESGLDMDKLMFHYYQLKSNFEQQ